ncbi:BatD family protein [Alteromonas sp. CYL-A6]|uniref:BatD family protein n=1 Tax=Alteromonas nitratireducens TaxID=3390813 RepID=UPI0034A955C8
MRTLVVFVLTLLLTAHAAAEITALTASVDKNPAMLDEAIRLTVTAEGDAPRDAFDSSALLGDFVVGRTSVSTQTSIVNFDTTKTTTWTTTLFPRNTGTFTIEPFTIEGKQTDPITVTVIPVSQSKGEEARDYFVETDVAEQDVFLQQQIYYTAKLYLATSIERGSLQAPTMPNADIRQLGDDKQYTDIKNGKRYQVIERRFAIVPQASGEFTIRGPVFTGEVLGADPGQRFGFFNRTREISRIGPDIVVNVAPIPDDVTGHWLPSELVRIDEEWPKGERYRVGEPVTRVLTLTAIGVVEEQLPELPSHYPPGFKLYPDQASTTTVEKDNNLIAQRKESLAIIPTKAGNFVLPEVTVPWFNVMTKKVEYATLPARSIRVEPAASSTERQTQPGAPTDIAQTKTPAQPATDTTASPLTEPGSDKPADSTTVLVLSVALAFCVAGWLVTVVYYRRQRSAPAVRQPLSGGTANHHERTHYNSLLACIDQRDAAAASRALSAWMQSLTPNSVSATQPGDLQATQALQPFLNQLQAARFSPHAEGSAFDWPTFKQTVENARNALFDKTSGRAFALKPLYPDQREFADSEPSR